jgi:hypothetical protein
MFLQLPLNYELVKFFFNSERIKITARGFPGFTVSGIQHRLYLDIKYRVAYTPKMVEILALTGSSAISLKTITPSVPIPIR